MKRPQVIGEILMRMLENPKIDSEGYCLKWYVSDDEVVCLVGIN